MLQKLRKAEISTEQEREKDEKNTILQKTKYYCYRNNFKHYARSRRHLDSTFTSQFCLDHLRSKKCLIIFIIFLGSNVALTT